MDVAQFVKIAINYSIISVTFNIEYIMQDLKTLGKSVQICHFISCYPFLKSPHVSNKLDRDARVAAVAVDDLAVAVAVGVDMEAIVPAQVGPGRSHRA